MACWKRKCFAILENPNRCYGHVYTSINDYMAIIAYLNAAFSVAFGIWIILTDRVKTGFTYPSRDYQMASFVLIFLPPFLFSLMSNYWFQADLWCCQLQPYMGLRQPTPAHQNLLLGYSCDLPVVITLKALIAGHWMLALTSAMPLVQKTLQVLLGSLLTIDTTTSTTEFSITFAALEFKAVLCILCAYLILIPLVWPGLNRRLPVKPLCIADSIVMFYDSTLTRREAFLPKHIHKDRWHMEYRLCLAERKYGFGIYHGRNGELNIGIDDAYSCREDKKGLRFVTPVKPPMRLYRRWMRRFVNWPAEKMRIQRQPILNEEEADALNRLQNHLKEDYEMQTILDQRGSVNLNAHERPPPSLELQTDHTSQRQEDLTDLSFTSDQAGETRGEAEPSSRSESGATSRPQERRPSLIEAVDGLRRASRRSTYSMTEN